MKCLVLAGGKGNSLWPLSREKYPKQFMNIRGKRSMFQETIARNLPFCDEFLIVTNRDYHFIIEGQMQIFQGVKYRCFLEDERRGTGAAITIVSMLYNFSEIMYVVTSDAMIDIENYKEAVMEGKSMANQASAVLFGIKVESEETNLGYILSDKNQVIEFKEKPEPELAVELIERGGLWNSGNLLFVIGNFLKEISRTDPQLFHACERIIKKLDLSSKIVSIPWEKFGDVPFVSIERAFLERSKLLLVVRAQYVWNDIGNFDAVQQWSGKTSKNTIIEKCTGTQVINESENQLIMVNNIDDALVINTDDAVLITSKAEAHKRKRLIKNHIDEFNEFFESGKIHYRSWGTYENLTKGDGFKVKKVTLYPGKAARSHIHQFRSEHWSVVQGSVSVTLNGKTKEYCENSGIYVKAGELHRIANHSDKNVVIIEVSIGTDLKEEDTISVNEYTGEKAHAFEALVKLEPVFKDFLWGGTKLRETYQKKCDYDRIAESWEMSAHPSGQSTIASGRHKGIMFGEYLQLIGKEAWGWKCQAFDRFPLLIKFIDAKENLSVQVHPDDDYALIEEGQYGKNEMWHILECDNNAYLYCGLKETISKGELEQALQDGKILDFLNKVRVKKGDTFFIDAGTIHAIGAGIVICEIQQNSDVTYRLYDYDRKDVFGRKRELHIKKGLDVVDLEQKKIEPASNEGIAKSEEKQEILGQCKYFECTKHTVMDYFEMENDDSSFKVLTFLNGTGSLKYADIHLRFCKGNCFFLCAGEGKLIIEGNCEFILTRV